MTLKPTAIRLMKNKTLLIIGDKNIQRNRPYMSFRRFCGYALKRAKKDNFDLKVISYAQLILGKTPAINASTVKIVLFFPYKFWNRDIERYREGRVYGERVFGSEFKGYLRRVKRIITRELKGKKIIYVNSPDACCVDRDKKMSKMLLEKNAVPTPQLFKPTSVKQLKTLLDEGKSLYIKPRFGAMGKGITYVNKENLISNFLFRKGALVSRSRDFNWKSARIRNKDGFLGELLKKGFICEEAINPSAHKGRRFDFRVYVMFGKVVYLYAKSSPENSLVTNWSQGGSIDKRKTILKTLPREQLLRLQELAKRTAQTLDLNFAGIDIIFSRDYKNVYVLEGNAFPGYEKGFDLMKCLLDLVVK